MSVAKISGPGLAAIAAAVALLWGCVFAERSMVRQAVIERAQVIRDLQRLQRRQRTEPVSLPSHRPSHRVRITAG